MQLKIALNFTLNTEKFANCEMNILLAINNLGTGGAETFVVNLAKGLADEGNKVFIWQVFYPLNNHIYQDIFSYSNIFEFESDHKEILQIIKNPRSIKGLILKRKLRKQVNKLKIHVINSHLFESDYLISNVFNLPHYISMHGSYEMYLIGENFENQSVLKGNNFLELAKKVLYKANGVIICAEKNKLIFDHIPKKIQFKKVNHGCEKKVENNFVKKEKIQSLGMLARGLKEKGWEILINSVIKVNQHRDTKIKLHLGFTSSPFMDNIKNKFGNLDWIEWHENVSRPSEFFQRIDLFVFPTYYSAESLPVVIIESLANRVPVVSSNIGDIFEMVKNGEFGIAGKILELKNNDEENVAALSSVLNQAINDSQIFMNWQENCEGAFEKFDLQKVAGVYLDIFKNGI